MTIGGRLKTGQAVGPLPQIVFRGAQADLVECFALPHFDSGFYLATRADIRDLPRIKAFNDFVVSRMPAAKPILEGRSNGAHGQTL